MSTKVYNIKSNAVRGFKSSHQDLADGLANATIVDLYIVEVEGGFSIKLDKVAAPTKRRHIYKGVPFRRRSQEPEGITSIVHDMFDEYQAEAEEAGRELKRKDYIAKAVRDGVAYYTARTQYQKWLRG